MNEHPAYFAANCPPPSAMEANNEVFRIVQDETIQDNDFKNYYELEIGPNCSPCGRCGISVFNSQEAAVALQKRMPRLGNFIAKGFLDSSAGKISQASRMGHHEWWPYINSDRASYFTKRVLCNI